MIVFLSVKSNQFILVWLCSLLTFLQLFFTLFIWSYIRR